MILPIAGLEFRDVWLEIKGCTDDTAAWGAIDEVQVRSIPALLEVLSTARDTNARMKDSGMWDYSRRLHKLEAEQIMKALNLTNKVEDERSVSLSANVMYENSGYTLTLFLMK